jgi:hypothetical protein
MSNLSVIVTGIVGALGIGGTLLGTWQSNRSQTANLMKSLQAQREGLMMNLQAQREGALWADCRALYAAYLTTVNALATALNGYPEDGDAATKRAYEAKELRQALQLLYDAHNEVNLTASSPEVRQAVGKATSAYEEACAKARADSARPRDVQKLATRWLDPTIEAMRVDLDLPADVVKQSAGIE